MMLSYLVHLLTCRFWGDSCVLYLSIARCLCSKSRNLQTYTPGGGLVLLQEKTSVCPERQDSFRGGVLHGNVVAIF